MIFLKQNEFNRISDDINKKLSNCGYTIDDLFFHHLHFGKKFTDPLGVYIAIEKRSYIVYHLNIHGVENTEVFTTRDELIFHIIWRVLLIIPYKHIKIIIEMLLLISLET